MTDELHDQLTRATAKHQRAERAEKAAYRELVQVIVAATDAHVPQVDIVKITGRTRERIRQIVDGERKARAESAQIP